MKLEMADPVVVVAAEHLADQQLQEQAPWDRPVRDTTEEQVAAAITMVLGAEVEEPAAQGALAQALQMVELDFKFLLQVPMFTTLAEAVAVMTVEQ